MNAADYSAWMKRAFLAVEGALLQRSAEESPTRISEDFIRNALVSGLKCSKASLANSVVTEEDAPWNAQPNVIQSSAVLGNGRPKQHDVAVKQDGNLLLVAETKWLKQSTPQDIMEDIWKLAMSHGTSVPERGAVRTFLLVGGMKDAFQKTLAALHRHDMPLRWSPQGRANAMPRPTTLKLKKNYGSDWGLGVLMSALKRRDTYYRLPPDVWQELRCTVLARSWKTIRGAEWKVALWELDHRAPCSKEHIAWNGLRKRIKEASV